MEPLVAAGGSYITTHGVLTVDDGATTFTTANAMELYNRGKYNTVSAQTNTASPTVDGVTGLAFLPVLRDQVCVLLFCVDDADAFTVSQGGIKDVDGDTDVALITPQFPAIPDDAVPFAYVVFQTDGTSLVAGETPESSNWNAAGLTSTVVNISTLPDRPQLD